MARMRRLATQSRGDTVKSSRDYQTITELGAPLTLRPKVFGKTTIASLRYSHPSASGDVAAFGGYFAAAKDVRLHFVVTDNSGNSCFDQFCELESQRHWTRIGQIWIQNSPSPHWTLTLTWQGESPLHLWGVGVASLVLSKPASEFIQDSTDGLEYLNKRHLSPESYYLSHGSPIGGASLVKRTNVEKGPSTRKNPGKKCSQCQRHLPIDPRLQRHRSKAKVARRSPQNMVLAFHGHKSKKTGYQNECRACKKFEINDHFNPRRTSDQLHESSVLTRERKLLLRENEVIKEFKQRVSKKGLRHYIWSLFNKKCFNCEVPVKLSGFELDHTRPLAYLWPLDRYATCLCSGCNNNKKDSFPIDYYNNNKLKQLSNITGLEIKDLRKRTVNQNELRRIRCDIESFAKSWSPRLFGSVASRVSDVEPEVDLFSDLRDVAPEIHDNIVATLSLRPAPVSEED
jgi:hypothetical protein